MEGQTFLLPGIVGKKVKPALVAGVGLLVFLTVIATVQLSGYWRTLPPNLNAAVTQNGALNPKSIRGFRTLQELASSFAVSLDKPFDELGFATAKVPPTTKRKEIRAPLGVPETEFDTQKVRAAVARLTAKEVGT